MTTLYQTEQDADTPLARWRFEETSGTTFADDVGAVTATLTGVVTPGSPNPNSAYPAPGVGADFGGGYASVSAASAWVPQSAEALVLLDNVTPTLSSFRPMIFCHAFSSTDMPMMLGWNIDGAHPGMLGVGFYSNAAGAFRTAHMTTSLSVGVLYHVVGVRTTTTTLNLWVNGSNVATGTVTAFTAGTKSATAYMGRRWDQPSQTIDGRYFDLALYSGALSSTRVAAHYAGASQLAGLQLTTGGGLVISGSPRGRGAWSGPITGGGGMKFHTSTRGLGAPAVVKFKPHPADYA